MISKYKDTTLVQKHNDTIVDRGQTKESTLIRPSSGVVYQPDVDKKEKVHGVPYKNKLREFQSSVLSHIARGKNNLLSRVSQAGSFL